MGARPSVLSLHDKPSNIYGLGKDEDVFTVAPYCKAGAYRSVNFHAVTHIAGVGPPTPWCFHRNLIILTDRTDDTDLECPYDQTDPWFKNTVCIPLTVRNRHGWFVKGFDSGTNERTAIVVVEPEIRPPRLTAAVRNLFTNYYPF